ncbi:MAG TPA: ROK family protein [Gaiellaceae bacterium]|nr:ROK family protein [Gaiellaceae bacterium]
MAAPLVIGVDVGGTKIRAAVADRDGRIRRRHELESPAGPQEEVLAAIDSAVAALLEETVGAVGLGIPGNLDARTGRLLRTTNLPLQDVDLQAWARARFGLPAAIENDANVAALAEWKLGAGRDVQTLVMITLGTGVGGGLVLGGELYRGWAEIGHVVVDVGGPPCQGNCHGHGHLEAIASGSAADRAARELWGPEADARLLVERARAGDDRAQARMAEIAAALGAAIGSFANLFNPELVVIGGGFGEAAGDLLLGPAQEAARCEALYPADGSIRLALAELGEDAGLVGASLIAFQALDGAW